MVELVDDPWLRPTGCTPLYAAIATACEKIKDGPRSRIVVVSDGSEDVQYKLPEDKEGSDHYYDFDGPKVFKNDVKRKLLEANTSLYVFQCNNLGFYQELIDARIFERSKLEEIKNSNAELQQLINEVSNNRPGPKSGKLLYQDFASLRESLLESLPYSAVTVIANQKQIGSGRVGHEIQLESVSKPTEATVTVQGFGLKAETKVWLVGNEKLELKYSEVSGLTNIPFNVNQGKTEVGEFPFEMQNKGQSKNLVFANPMPDRSLKKLAVRVAISGTSKDLEQKNFTRRPEFAVAAMTPSDGLPESSRLISDFYFYQGTHYPILQFPAFTWKRDEVWLSDKVDFDIWIANQMPSAALALKRSPKNGEEGELLEHVKYSRNENRITVLIGPESSERYYVICDSASKSERQFVDGRETQVVFEIGDTRADQPVDVFVVRENDLKSAVENGVIQHYSRKGMNFRK